MKNTYYFSHDYYARNDPKLEELFLKLGCEGRGIYWTLIEMLYENKGYLVYDKLDYYANALRTDIERIAKVLNDFDLFKNDGKVFWSESVLNRLRHLEEKREKARQSAFKKWHKDANALPSVCERIAIKDSIVKESKDNTKELFLEFVLLTKEEHQKLLKTFGEIDTKAKIQKLNNYIGSTGKKYKSHYHTILNWASKEAPTVSTGTIIRRPFPD